MYTMEVNDLNPEKCPQNPPSTFKGVNLSDWLEDDWKRLKFSQRILTEKLLGNSMKRPFAEWFCVTNC